MKQFYLKLLTILLITCAGTIVYSNTLLCSFHFDDIPSIIDNPLIRNLYNLQNIWNIWPCRFITFFSLALNYHFYQLNVFGYHLFNLGIHLATSILVWWFVYLTFSTPAMKDAFAGKAIGKIANLISLFSGLIFATHPIQTQAVTFIWQRAASLATLFYLASLCFYIKSRILEKNRPASRVYYACSLMTAFMSMFTKEIVITLPLMVVLYEISFLRTKKDFKWMRLIPFLLLLSIIPLTMALSGSAKIWATHSRPTPNFATNISSMQYLLTEFRVAWTYIRLAFLPLHQNLDYDYPLSKSILEAPTLLSFISLLIVLFLAQRMFAKYRLVSFAVFWFFLTLLPESSLFPFADVIFEHRLYLPMVGYSIFLASGMYYLFGKNSIKAMVIALTMIIACNSVLTYQRNKIWRDEITLWNDAVGKSPHKARPYNNRGLEYSHQGKPTQALSDFNKAIEINPDYANAYNNRGSIYDSLGNFTQAISDFNRAIKTDPDYVEAYYNRGTTYARQNNLAQAMSDYNKAIEIDPNYAHAYNNRGIINGIQGNLTQAMSDFDKAIDIDPRYVDAYNNRAFTYYHLKEYDNAWEDVHKAEGLGASVNPGLFGELKKATGRSD